MVSDHVAATVHKDGEITSFHESVRPDGHAAWAALDDNNLLSQSISGPGSHGEEQTHNCCVKLIGKLNRLGATWGEPVLVEKADVDCRVTDRGCPESNLHIQVVRADPHQERWQQLSTSGQTKTWDLPASDLASSIRHAIDKKQQRIPSNARGNILLALDATLLPAYGFNGVIQAFHRGHGSWAASLGFLEIWLVGQTNELCHRLDRHDAKAHCFSDHDIAVAAYFIWESEGRRHGRHIDHWFMGIENLSRLRAGVCSNAES